MKKLILLIPFIIIILNAEAQNKNLKWGKVSDEEIALKEVSFQPDAEAVILNSSGSLSFGTSNIIIEQHIRIKILNENGKDYATIKIPVYKNTETITNLKAQTINFDANQKPVVIKVEDNEFYKTDIDDDWQEISFTFPTVNEGTIIEYKFTLTTSNVIFLTAWIFQDRIPTLYSKFSAQFPSNLIYTYNVFYQGDRLLKKYGSTTSSEWELENLPGLSEDIYVYSIFDDAELLRFQLASYYTKSDTYAMDGSYETKKYVPSWDEMAETLLNNSGFSSYLLFASKTQPILDTLIADLKTNTEKIAKIYSYVSSNYLWDGTYKKHVDKTLNDIIEDKKGNSSEINLLLTALLKQAGFTAYPVLISTKSHGKINKEYPVISLFNNIIVAVKLGNVYQLLDATDPFRPYNLLAVEDLNYFGFLLDKTDYKWLDIAIPESTKQTVNAKIDLSKPDIQNYEYEFKFDSYFAVEQRKKYFANPENYIFENLIENTDLIFDSLKLENTTDLTKTFILKCWLHKNTNDIFDNNLAYIDFINLKNYNSNPFSQESRIQPVDLAYKYSEDITVRVYYPENYIAEEIPVAKTSTLVDNTGKFTFSSYNIDNYVKLESKLIISETLFFADEYPKLKTFFTEIIAKYNEPVVLKKK